MTTTFDQLVTDVQQTLAGYGLAQPRAAFLVGSITATTTTITVRDAKDFSQGIAEIDNEIVFVDSVDFASNVLTLAPDGRGYYGTTAATHASNARITMAPVWPRQRIATAINEAILGTYPTLFATATATVPYNPVVTTYELPADCDRVLKVTTDTIGPSGEQVELTRWSFNSVAPTSEYANGNTLTVEKGGFPGRNLTITYAKPPASITWGNAFTVSGLAETAKLAIKYAACSTLLAFMDISRLPVDTAQADEYDQTKFGIGNAARLSAQLYQHYLVELETERKRLRSATPVKINVRTR